MTLLSRFRMQWKSLLPRGSAQRYRPFPTDYIRCGVVPGTIFDRSECRNPMIPPVMFSWITELQTRRRGSTCGDWPSSHSAAFLRLCLDTLPENVSKLSNLLDDIDVSSPPFMTFCRQAANSVSAAIAGPFMCRECALLITDCPIA